MGFGAIGFCEGTRSYIMLYCILIWLCYKQIYKSTLEQIEARLLVCWSCLHPRDYVPSVLDFVVGFVFDLLQDMLTVLFGLLVVSLDLTVQFLHVTFLSLNVRFDLD